jgi:phosphoribosyl 1,2-cyclic phosphate phosphodiesterase
MTEMTSPLTITVLGSGTSAGVPMIGCHCPVCSSTDPRDRRTRPSIAVSYAGHTVLIDTTPELRLQACAVGLDRIDAVVYTHAHADHIFGLDDVRRFNTILGHPLPLYARPEALATLRQAFPYAFAPRHDELSQGMYRPELAPVEIAGPFSLFDQTWTPIEMPHGRFNVLGYRIGNFAYCTDCHEIPPAQQAKLEGLDVLVIDALRPRPHPTHLSFEQAEALIAQLRPKRAYFTHLAHDVSHAQIESKLPPHIRVLYDGLRLTV